jgi:transposase
MVTAANVTDRNGAVMMTEYYCNVTSNLNSVLKYLVDGGYTGEPFANSIKELVGAEVEVAKRSELHTFAVIPKRWIVERTFGWLDKCRRLWKNCERRLQNTFQMVTIAFIRILLNRF